MNPKHVVLIGGGHTHALVLHHWHKLKLDNVKISLINPGLTAPYSGMLPGYVAGHYSRQELDINLNDLLNFKNTKLINGYANSIDVSSKKILLRDKTEITYDIASLDVGITSDMPKLKGFSQTGIPAKPLGDFASKWSAYLSSTDAARIVIIGGGVAGCELAMAMAFAIGRAHTQKKVCLIDSSSILSGVSTTAQRKIRRNLNDYEVQILEHTEVSEIDRCGVFLNNGDYIEADFICGAAGAKPHEWIENTHLKLCEGFVIVDEYLQTSNPDIFAVGDCAHMEMSPRPKAGVFAVRQAPTLLDNIRAKLTGQPMKAYEPQRDYLKLISLGDKRAIGEKFGMVFEGRYVWRIKDHIDRTFMNQFTN